ncbi:urease accessory protein ureH [Rubidibacter lacunae KORDI 51-2]|uniref:Urease accessory protein UreD n=1 Tax=Rubidibacter lacunae KORDI 51-2 TaxID=582515 RepID=U5DKK2_9CHRO|nr:urease accessory protein UreD [Rubidibacter lacunae]ERN42206.1 urease accessory protein ureH [Rubidibacter lacunae KORDI 51-2]
MAISDISDISINPQAIAVTATSDANLHDDAWFGSLDLNYVWRDGATQVARSRHQSPLKVQRPFYPEGRQICHSLILHTAGGIVGGDRLTQALHLQPDARALVTTPAATKIYRSNGRQATQAIAIHLGAEAWLDWLPQEAIAFDGARYRQELRVDLAPSATWLGWDVTRFGRSARGERFLSGEWRSRVEVWRQGKPLWIDRQYLRGGRDIDRLNALAGRSVVGTLAWFGGATVQDSVVRELVAEARSLWQPQGELAEAGVTRARGDGLLCRYRGTSTTEAKRWFVGVWELLRREFAGRSPVMPRAWQWF